MNEEQNNEVKEEAINEEVKEVQPIQTPVPVANEEIKEEQAVQTPEPVVNEEVKVEQLEQTPVPIEQPNGNKKGNKLIPIIAILVILALTGGCLFFFTDIFKGNEKGNNDKDVEDKQDESLAEKYEGIYSAENDNMYIHKKSNNEFYYTIGGNFQGVAKVEGDTAKEENRFNDDSYFEFKLENEGINLIYHTADENTEVAADTGLYKKVATYNKENIYKYAVGDPKYLSEKYSGIFKNDDIEFYLIQKNENEVMVNLKYDSNNDLPIFSETFEIQSEDKLISKSIFEEDKIAYEITFNDKEFTFKANTDVFGVHEDEKKLEKNIYIL